MMTMITMTMMKIMTMTTVVDVNDDIDDNDDNENIQTMKMNTRNNDRLSLERLIYTMTMMASMMIIITMIFQALGKIPGATMVKN